MEAVRVNGRGTHRTLLRLGEVSELRDTGQLDRIIAALRNHADGTWLQADELSGDAAPGFGAIAAIHHLFGRLDLDQYFNDLGDRRGASRLADTVFVMVANRLISPASKRRTVIEWVDGDVELPAGVVAPSLDQCYRALDTVAATKQATRSPSVRPVDVADQSRVAVVLLRLDVDLLRNHQHRPRRTVPVEEVRLLA